MFSGSFCYCGFVAIISLVNVVADLVIVIDVDLVIVAIIDLVLMLLLVRVSAETAGINP